MDGNTEMRIFSKDEGDLKTAIYFKQITDGK
jgi:hypothetical protein